MSRYDSVGRQVVASPDGPQFARIVAYFARIAFRDSRSMPSTTKLTSDSAADALDRAAQEAIDWEIRMRDDRITAAEREAFEAWLCADRVHKGAWARLQERFGRFGALQRV